MKCPACVCRNFTLWPENMTNRPDFLGGATIQMLMHRFPALRFSKYRGAWREQSRKSTKLRQVARSQNTLRNYGKYYRIRRMPYSHVSGGQMLQTGRFYSEPSMYMLMPCSAGFRSPKYQTRGDKQFGNSPKRQEIAGYQENLVNQAMYPRITYLPYFDVPARTL